MNGYVKSLLEIYTYNDLSKIHAFISRGEVNGLTLIELQQILSEVINDKLKQRKRVYRTKRVTDQEVMEANAGLYRCECGGILGTYKVNDRPSTMIGEGYTHVTICSKCFKETFYKGNKSD